MSNVKDEYHCCCNQNYGDDDDDGGCNELLLITMVNSSVTRWKLMACNNTRDAAMSNSVGMVGSGGAGGRGAGNDNGLENNRNGADDHMVYVTEIITIICIRTHIHGKKWLRAYCILYIHTSAIYILFLHNDAANWLNTARDQPAD